MIGKQEIIQIYQHFSRKVDDREYWSFKPTPKQDVMLDNFIKLIDLEYGSRSIGRHFMLEYFAYQYLRWYEKNDTQFGKTVMISWLIGKKAFERWMTRSDGWSFRIRQKILNPYKISLETIFPSEKMSHNSLELFPHEESIKRRFRKDENILGYCAENTTLYNKRSKWCVMCKKRTDCKEALRSMYPSIYIQRGYATKG